MPPDYDVFTDMVTTVTGNTVTGGTIYAPLGYTEVHGTPLTTSATINGTTAVYRIYQYQLNATTTGATTATVFVPTIITNAVDITTNATHIAYGTTAGVSTMQLDAWRAWNDEYCRRCTATNAQVWTHWNDDHEREHERARELLQQQRAWQEQRIRQATPEEVRAAQERETLRQAERIRRAAELDAATRRAEDLLREHLTEEQAKHLDAKQCFYLEVNGRRYRIDRGTHGNVKLLDKDGKILGAFCIQPSGVPVPDSMLAQKLWLEGDEKEFLRVANFSAWADQRGDHPLIRGVQRDQHAAREAHRARAARVGQA